MKLSGNKEYKPKNYSKDRLIEWKQSIRSLKQFYFELGFGSGFEGDFNFVLGFGFCSGLGKVNIGLFIRSFIVDFIFILYIHKANS